MLSRVATPSSADAALAVMNETKALLPVADIAPAVWNPAWTRVYLNADLIAVIPGDAEAFHKELVKARRSGKLDRFVSLAWNRLNNT